MGIGRRLKEARITQKMTQQDLAKAIGVSKGAIGNYETDVSSPNEPILIKLMSVLQIDANYLYQDYIVNDLSLTSEEQHLITLWRGADDRARDDAIRTLADHQKKDTSAEAI